MSLSSGTQIGSYEIAGPLGAGGMGEVYRAKDLTLQREVAIKVLPTEVAQDTARLSRFEREARLLASLNHPNIAQIYGFEKASLEKDSEAHFLVMELVPGEDLSEMLQRGPIPVQEAIRIAGQIVEALEEAHEKGIIHRDLKPANIRMTPDGKVKVLDFGLAKAFSDETGDQATPDLTHSPTLPAATQMGVILGTAAYMSPEQAKGKSVDRRADIWAFGVVLYEMLTGQQLFAADTLAETLGQIFSREPEFETLPPDTPASMVRLIRRCLVRDPKRRLRDIGDARLELEATDELPRLPIGEPPRVFASRPAMILLWVFGLLALSLGSLYFLSTEPEGIRESFRMSIALPDGHALLAGPEITRDGERIAFVSSDGYSPAQLYTRRLDEAELKKLDGAEAADQIFFSPDGRWIAFYARNALYKTRVDGIGEPVRLADAATSKGGHWLEDGTIVYTPAWNSGLYRIDSNGGTPEPLLIPDRTSYYAYVWPTVSPDGKSLLFARWGTTSDLMHLDLQDMSQSVIAVSQWRRAIQTTSGHIIFSGLGGDLLVLPADPELARTATPETVLTNVAGAGDPHGYSRISVSASGTLVYSPVEDSKRSLVAVDPSGNIEPLPTAEAGFGAIEVSPDGRRAVVTEDLELFVLDLVRGNRFPLTSELSRGRDHGHWSPDGSRIVFAANYGGTWDIYSKDASGTGEAKLLFAGPFDQYPISIMRDGTILYEESHDVTAKDIWLLPPEGAPQPWRVTPASEDAPVVSPDDQLLAFGSSLSGRYELYVQPMDRSSDAVAVSTRGGEQAVWSPSGDSLLFRQGNLLMKVSVRLEPRLEVGEPELVLDAGWSLGRLSLGSSRINYDFFPDGRLLMVRSAPEAIPSRIGVILNWFDELQRLVPR